MEALVISPLAIDEGAIEIVERKGLGHPDSICDALAETLARNLCLEYRRRFGQILHHNVDKALLRGGRAAAQFGGGRVLAPIEIHLAGRATVEVAGETVPIAELAVEGSRSWLAANLHALDAASHVRIHVLVAPGSLDLRTLFARRSRPQDALANDTSIGVGYAPLSMLERLVLAVEQRINARNRDLEHPAWGEDVKVMAVRRGEAVSLTVACAMIGRHIAHLDDYLAEVATMQKFVQAIAAQHGFAAAEVTVNAADDPSAGSIYLTVTGTSAEAGDDGEVGRGNRVNGLITPCRPMSLEAAAGKNPVTHAGKIYNVLARGIAESLTAEIAAVAAAQCFMVSRIGAPLARPALLQVKLATRDGMPAGQLRAQVEDVVADHLSGVPKLIEDFVAGRIELY